MSDKDQVVSLTRDVSSFVERQQLGEATSQIQYVSNGHALIIGQATDALQAGAALKTKGFSVVEIDPAIDQMRKRLTDDGVAVFTVPALTLSGYLGAFKAIVPAPAGSDTPFDLAVSVYCETGYFDLVLDLSANAIMPAYLPPFGYRHALTEGAVLEAVSEFQDMHGEFEKPRYFNFDAGICAHSRSNLSGCTRCIDVCAAGAIVSNGEGVSVDPFLCQGCGSCATVCPSGAMTYAYPRASNAIDRVRNLLHENDASVVLLYTELHETLVDEAELSSKVLPMMVEEVSAFGADFWLSLLAGNACRIVLISDAADDDPSRLAIAQQIALVHELLQGLGVDESVVVLTGSDVLSSAGAQATSVLHPDNWQESALLRLTPSDFATHNDKRQTIRLALDALSEQLAPMGNIMPLSPGAPFGHVTVDKQACTLCMACVSTCPAKALLDGQGSPAVRFVEANCLQCGLCETACPESAISLQPQYTWDSISARQIKTLHEEEPFHCVVCHTPFTTRAMIETMSAKLSDHWMFKENKALRRLKMCGDCRVRDMFEEDRQGIDVHKPS